MKKSKLEHAVDWFFSGGYSDLAKNKEATNQSKIASAVVALNRVAKLLNLSPSEALEIIYSGRNNGR